MDKTEVTPEGWVVADLKFFRLIADHPPPRPHGYLHQLWIDCRNWKPIAMWVIGIGIMTAAVVTGWWLFLPLGGVLLVGWFVMFRNTVRYIRETPAGVGLVETLKPHPLMRDYSTGVALMPDGRQIPVSFPTRLIEGIMDKDGRAEILFLHDPRDEFALGLGARAALESEE